MNEMMQLRDSQQYSELVNKISERIENGVARAANEVRKSQLTWSHICELIRLLELSYQEIRMNCSLNMLLMVWTVIYSFQSMSCTYQIWMS